MCRYVGSCWIHVEPSPSDGDPSESFQKTDRVGDKDTRFAAAQLQPEPKLVSVERALVSYDTIIVVPRVEPPSMFAMAYPKPELRNWRKICGSSDRLTKFETNASPSLLMDSCQHVPVPPVNLVSVFRVTH